jgi:hypothetical protein
MIFTTKHLIFAGAASLSVAMASSVFKPNNKKGLAAIKVIAIQAAGVFSLKLQKGLTPHSQQRGVRAVHT